MTTLTSILRIAVTIIIAFSVSISVAQPEIFVDPEALDYELPHGTTRRVAIDISNEGDSLLLVTLQQEAVPDRDNQLKILAWTRYADPEEEWRNTQISLNSLEFDYEITEFVSENEEDWRELLQNADVLLIPDPENVYIRTLEQIGDRMYDVLQDFVDEGGFVVATDFSAGAAMLLGGADLLNIAYPPDRSNQHVSCESVGYHVLSSGVHEYTALSGNNLHVALDEDAFAVTRGIDSGLNNITARRIGEGGVVYLGMDWRSYNREMTQLLINAIMWVKGGSSWLIIDEFVGEVEPFDSENILFTIKTDLVSSPGEYHLDLILTTNDPEQPEIRVPVDLTVTDRIPVELTIDPEQVFVIGDENRDTSVVVSIRNISAGSIEDAEVTLEDSDQRWLTLNRREITIGPRLTDRLLLTFDPDNCGDEVNANRIIISFDNPEPTNIFIPVHYYTGNSFGSVEGVVSERGDNERIEGATVNLHGLSAVSNENGQYRLESVPSYSYVATVTHPDYMALSSDPIQIENEETYELNVGMSYAVMESDLLDEEIRVTVPIGENDQVEGYIRNSGTGVLEFTTQFTDLDPPEYIAHMSNRMVIETGDATEADPLFGVTYFNDNFYVSGSPDFRERERIYVLDRNGNFLRSFEQPNIPPSGLTDLTHRDDIIYGSGNGEIIGINVDGEVEDRIHHQFGYNSAITYDDQQELFWVANANGVIRALDLDGEEVMSIENPGLYIRGLTWFEQDSDGFHLHIFSRDGVHDAQINRMNVETGEVRFVQDLPSDNLERANGIAITGEWDPRRWTLITQFSGRPNRMMLSHLTNRTEWVGITPSIGFIQPDEELEMFINFDATGFSGDERLEGAFSIAGNYRGGADTIFVQMRIFAADEAVLLESDLLPSDIGLSTYPNPFNAQLRIRYRVPLNSPVDVSLYDTQGRLVDQLLNGVQRDTDSGTLLYNASDLSSGLYFVVLKSGDTKQHQRVVLMK